MRRWIRQDATRRLIAVSLSAEIAGMKPVKAMCRRLLYAFRGPNV